MENLFKEREELNKKLIEQERVEAAVAAKEEALSTLSHYLNNAVMIISGQSQLIRIMKDNNQIDKLLNKIPSSMDEIQKSVDKIIAVMDVLKEISPLNHNEYFSYSRALNIDDRISKRLKKIGAT
jgi:signal transduction histidine kinase